MIINAPYTPSNLRGGGNYHSDHTPPKPSVITSPSCEEVALPRQTGESEGVKPEGLGA